MTKKKAAREYAVIYSGYIDPSHATNLMMQSAFLAGYSFCQKKLKSKKKVLKKKEE